MSSVGDEILKKTTLQIMRSEPLDSLTRRVIKRKLEELLHLPVDSLQNDPRIPSLVASCIEVITQESKEEEDADEEPIAQMTKKTKHEDPSPGVVSTKPTIGTPAPSTTTEASSGKAPEFIPLGNDRRVTVSKFRKNVLVDIREYYTDKDGEQKPGKKGISLSKEQFLKLRSSIETIHQMLQALE